MKLIKKYFVANLWTDSMLEEFIQSNGLKATLIRFEKDVANPKAAASVLKIELSDIARTVVLFDEEKSEAILAVVLANNSVDIDKVSKITGYYSLEPASDKDAVEITGYEAGIAPPISIFGTKTFVDAKVMKKEIVYAGGGDKQSILKISPKEIEEFGWEVQVEDITADWI